MSEEMCTPKNSKTLSRITEQTPGGFKSPAVHIPATPFLKKMGFGTGVSVFLYPRSPQAGKLMSPWAVKKLNKPKERSMYGQRLENEAKVLRTLSHPNIIGYRAFKTNESGSQVLLMENGQKSLFDLMETRDEEVGKPFEAKKIETVIRCCALALDYLHTEKQIMHGDIKSGNVLIVGDFETVKLCDFGVTVPVNSEGIISDPEAQYVGTEAWSAIEVLNDEDVVTTKAEIFALGLVIFEMLSLHHPHIDKLFSGDTTVEDSENVDEDESFDDSTYREALGKRPALPDNVDLDSSYKKALEIFFATTQDDPKLRPSAKEILEMLDAEDLDDNVVCVKIVEAPSAV